MLAAPIDHRCCRRLPKVIQTAANQGESLARKSFTGGEKSSFPLNQGFTVC